MSVILCAGQTLYTDLATKGSGCVITYQPWKLTSDVNKSHKIGQQPNRFFICFSFVTQGLVCCKITRLALKEPGVEMDDSRDWSTAKSHFYLVFNL